jgi:PHD/YefM family antitoxin component YafN of YafNO toxin-antitoxin module
LPKEPQFLYALKIRGARHDQDTFAERSANPILRYRRSSGALLEQVVVTKNGRPEAVVMGAVEFESWVETLELLSNPKAVKSIKQGLKEAKARKLHSFKDAFGEEQ